MERSHGNEKGEKTGRHERWAVALLLGIIALQCIPLLNTLAPTYDAYAHVPAGYTYLVRKEFEIYKHNPPLIQMLIALPLFFIGPELPPEENSYEEIRWEYAAEFHELNEDRFDDIFFYCRFPALIMSLILAWIVWRWCRNWFGPAGGLTGLSLLAFNPFFLAHSQLATLDIGTSLFTTLTFWFLAAFLYKRKWNLFLIASILFGLSQAAKYSSLLLVVVVPLLMFFALMWPGMTHPEGKWKKRTRKPSWQMGGLTTLIVQLFMLGVVCCIVICAVYAFDRVFIPLKDYDFISMQMTALQKIGPLQDIPLPLPYYYLDGLDAQHYLNQGGFSTYLLGETSQFGFWNFFLVAFLAKMPLGFLLLLAISFVIWAWVFLKKRDLRWIFLLTPVMIFGLYFSLMINVQCGLRYLLPVIPLIVVFTAMAGKKLWESGKAGRAVLLLASGVNLFSCISIYPDYLAFFNQAWGGPSNGHNIIVATDLDWGQDLKKARDYIHRECADVPSIETSVFGVMNPADYGIEQAGIFTRFPSTGWKLISIQHAINAFNPVPDRTWLLSFEPVKKFGYTLLLYNITPEDMQNVFTDAQLEAFRLANEADAIKKDDPAAALAFAKDALVLIPDSWSIHHFIGQLYRDLKDTKKSDWYFKKSMQLNPKGVLYINAGRDTSAE